VWNDAQVACIFEPFRKATGINAVNEPNVSATTLVKLRQQKDAPEIDAAWMDGGISEQAWEMGLLDPIDPKTVPNIAGLVDQGIMKKDGQIYALQTGFYAQGILYNTNEVKEKPASWWDLWKPEYEGRVIFPSPAQAPFVPLFMHLNRLLGGDSTNFAPALDKFRTLKVSTYFDTTGIVQTAIQAGDVAIGAYYVNTAWSLKDAGLPIAAVAPKEGSPAGDTRLHLVKGSKHKDAALKFIDFALRPESLDCLAEKLYLGPPLKNPQISDNAKGKMPWGPEGSIKNLVIPDFLEVIAKRPQITDLWNRRVVAH
jgi:putative spermidine/putrescine transport system substrate-binding protein